MQNESPMTRRHKTSSKLFFNLAGVAVFALLAIFIFNSIQENNPITTGKPPVHKIKSAFSVLGTSYELEDHERHGGNYIGNNSGVVAILEGLPGASYRKTIELQTKVHPYGLTVNYGPNSDTTGYDGYWTDEKRIFLYNATVLFMLIDNVDYIEFHLESAGTQANHVQVTRSEIETLYGRDVRTYMGNPESWNAEVLDEVFSNTQEIERFLITD